MLDFTELPQDGQLFEQLVRELLFSLGYKIFWTGRGADGGRDLLCLEERPSIFRLTYAAGSYNASTRLIRRRA